MAAVIAHVAPDAVLLTKIDYDHGLHALHAFADLIRAQGHDLPHAFALRPNGGWRTGIDMTGDGRADTADDAQGYGAFAGAGGMAILSRLELDAAAVRDFSGFLWRDLPGARLPRVDGALYPSDAVFGIQRLSSTGHWDVPLRLPGGGRLSLLGFYASPPVFGGAHGRNRLRNHDEAMFWVHLLDGTLPMPAPDGPFVLLGGSNLDPHDGDGKHAAMRRLLAHPRLQDPEPRSAGARVAAQHPASLGHRGDPALDTTHWTRAIGPGNLRVDYVLPSADLTVRGAGVFWPAPDDPLAALLGPREDPPTRHRLVWVDIVPP